MFRDITPLARKPRNDTVKRRALIMQRFSRIGRTHSLFTSAERTEVFACLGRNAPVQLKNKTTHRLPSNGDVEENNGVSEIRQEVIKAVPGTKAVGVARLPRENVESQCTHPERRVVRGIHLGKLHFFSSSFMLYDFF